MTCTVQELNIVRGVSKTLRLTVVDEDGDAVDLTDAVVYFSVKILLSDAEAVIEKTSETPADITILAQSGDTLGKADIFLVPSDTLSLSAEKHYYDVWVELVTGARYCVVSPSAFWIRRGVTDWTV